LSDSIRRFKEVTGNILLAALLLMLCFPQFEPLTDTGIDPPLLWAYNYFFAHSIQSGVDVLFTHGPLALLINPLVMGHNFETTLIITSAVYLLFFYAWLELGRHVREGKWVSTFLVLLILGHLVPMVYLLAGLTVGGILLYHEKGRVFWLIVACFSAVLGFYIKAGFGFLAFFPIYAYAAIYFLRYKRYTIPVICVIGPIVAYVIIWLAIYGNLHGLGKFLYATYELAKGNSDGASLYPINNWTLLFAAALCIIALPFVIHQRRIYLLFALFALSLFGTWKHGFSREDTAHVKGSIIFLVMALGLVLIYMQRRKPVHLVFLSIPPVLLYINMMGFAAQPPTYYMQAMNFTNFYNEVLNRDEYCKSFEGKVRQNLEASKLDEETRRLIGNSTIDIYPFDFSFVPANGLNWKPRPVLQTYAAYTTWLDKQNANHFDSNQAPDFILWHLSGDMHGQIASIDNRYLLNDEPQGILSILNHYKLVRKTNRIMLFQKTNEAVLSQTKVLSKQSSEWGKWIDVPAVQDGILRVKLNPKGTMLRSLTRFLYKDGAYFAEYKLASNEVRKFRIVLSNAVDGIWVNPLIIHASDSFMEYPVTQIRFLASNPGMMKPEIKLVWEHTPIANSTSPDSAYTNAQALFGKTRAPERLILQTINRFNGQASDWTEASKNALVKLRTGNTYYRLDTNLFSPSFNYPLPTISADSIISVYAAARCRLPEKSEAKLVVSVTDSSGTKYWEGMLVHYFVTEFQRWEYVYTTHDLPKNLPPSARISVSIWNTGKKPIEIDDLEVKLYQKAASH
jgi:hypothetical protein